ncbi:MAG: ribonuclease HIII [Enterococcus lemanii]|jgi:ribonuclease HIII
MAPVVLKLSKTEIDKIKKFYHNDKIDKNIPYTEFIAKTNQTTITIYTSGKVMFQGSAAQQEASRWSKNESLAKTTTKDEKTTKTNRTQQNVLPIDIAQKSLIGSDEVGNGSYFGPLIVCAVFASTEQLPALKALGVKDSKMLTDSDIQKLAPKIKEQVAYKILEVTPKKYNEIQPQYNAVRMKVALHNQAIGLLLNEISPTQPDYILIDQFTPEANYRKYLKTEKNQVTNRLLFTTKAEQYHLAVAAASILCRAQFLDSLKKGSEELGFSLPSGAGLKSDQVAARILKKGGLSLLENYAKLHFANTKKAQKIAGDYK